MIKANNIQNTIKNLNKKFNRDIEAQKLSKMNSLVNSLKQATPIDTGEARDNWKIENSSIKNETEYISYLNEGSSQQAPSFFIERTVLTHKGISPSGMIVKTI